MDQSSLLPTRPPLAVDELQTIEKKIKIANAGPKQNRRVSDCVAQGEGVT